MGQQFDLLVQPVGIESLKRRHNAGVQRPTPLLEETAVGDLVGKGMLEGVFPLGKEARFVEELCPWSCARLRYNAASGTSAMARRSGKGTSWPITAAVCRSRFSSAESRSIRAASIACTVAGTCRLVRGCVSR